MATRQWNIWGGTDGWRKERTRVFKEKGTKRTVVDQGWRATDIHQGLASWRGGPAVADGREGDPKKKLFWKSFIFFLLFSNAVPSILPQKVVRSFRFWKFWKKIKNDLEWTPSIFCFVFQTDFVRWIIKKFWKKQTKSIKVEQEIRHHFQLCSPVPSSFFVF